MVIVHKHNFKFNVKNHDFFDLVTIKEYFEKYNNNETIFSHSVNKNTK